MMWLNSLNENENKKDIRSTFCWSCIVEKTKMTTVVIHCNIRYPSETDSLVSTFWVRFPDRVRFNFKFSMGKQNLTFKDLREKLLQHFFWVSLPFRENYYYHPSHHLSSYLRVKTEKLLDWTVMLNRSILWLHSYNM